MGKRKKKGNVFIKTILKVLGIAVALIILFYIGVFVTAWF